MADDPLGTLAIPAVPVELSPADSFDVRTAVRVDGLRIHDRTAAPG